MLGLTGIGLVDAHDTTAAALAYFRDHGSRRRRSSSPASRAARISETWWSPIAGRRDRAAIRSTLIYQQLAADNAGAVAIEFLDSWSASELTVSPAQAIVRFGRQQQFTAAVSCPEGAGAVWSVLESCAGTIDANGLYTAPRLPTATRTVHVVATSTADGSVQGVATVSLRVSN